MLQKSIIIKLKFIYAQGKICTISDGYYLTEDKKGKDK